MARPEKVAEVEILTEKMQKSEGVILADFSGLTVIEVNELRVKCREQGVEFRVVKNSLARRAATAADLTDLDGLFSGPTAIAFGFESPVEPAKVLAEFAKQNEKIQIKGGLAEGKLISVAEVEALGALPGRDELLAMIARGFNAPTQGFVNVLQGTVSAFVRALSAVADQRGEAEPES
jgi:large subunit ribosomal protein L10